jgi:hypothetical protein
MRIVEEIRNRSRRDAAIEPGEEDSHASVRQRILAAALAGRRARRADRAPRRHRVWRDDGAHNRELAYLVAVSGPDGGRLRERLHRPRARRLVGPLAAYGSRSSSRSTSPHT